ncbi:MAG: hypothetical protein ACFFKA_10715 [Candidatus Thorarchaeota archaeon]
MSDINSVHTSKKINDEISRSLNWINKKSRDYIKDIIILISKEIGIKKIISILLFGSQQSDLENVVISDCDLLFIFKDRVSNHHLKEIERYFIALEIKHNFKDPSTKLTKTILEVINYSTGMFISHFLTKKEFWDRAKFHKIFHVNRVFSSIFAPRNIVLSNVILNSTLLFGEDLRNALKPSVNVSITEMFRSTVMNLFICFFGIVLTPRPHLNSIKYLLESVKWSLKSANYYCFADTAELSKIIERFIALEKKRKRYKTELFFEKFMNLRAQPQNDLKFILLSPFKILNLHIKAISYRKMVKRKTPIILTKQKEKIIDQRLFMLRF